MQYEHQVEGPGLERSIILALQHKEEVLGKREILLRMAYVKRASLFTVTQHIVSVCDDGRKLAHQLYALTHKVFAGSVIGIRVKGVEFEHASGEYVHNVPALKFNDMQKRILFQRHILHEKIMKLLNFLFIRKIA